MTEHVTFLGRKPPDDPGDWEGYFGRMSDPTHMRSVLRIFGAMCFLCGLAVGSAAVLVLR